MDRSVFLQAEQMRIAIIETGLPPEQLQSKYPRYTVKMERMLSPVHEGFSFSHHAVAQGDPLPTLDTFDGLLITGSAAGVYEGHDWIAPTEGLVRAAATARKPQIGICFGHQIMATAFGGTVRKSEKGWGVGLHTYKVDASRDWMEPVLGRMSCVVSHQDQVIDLPPTARVLGGSEFCPHGLLDYDHAPAFSMQPHPEFTHEFAADLLQLRRDKIGSTLADEAHSTLKKKTDRGDIARWIARFYLTNR